MMAFVACGKKGPPLAPLRIAPTTVTELSARRVGDRVQLRFTLPEKNTDNSTPADVARVEVHALSVQKPADAPQGDLFFRAAERVASVTPAAEQTAITVSEQLDAAALKYYVPKTPTPTPPVPTAAKAAAPVAPPVPVRMYLIVPVSRRGHRGAPASATVPLVDAPPPPPPPFATFSEQAISLAWVAAEDARYHVYEVPEPDAAVNAPLTQSPLAKAAFEDPRIEFGKPRCYRVTSVVMANQMSVESAPSPAVCVTPVDTFAPPAPGGLGAVAGPGSISLIWDAVSAPDLAGYVVLRGSAPGDTLQALTAEPLKETTYRDATVTAGQTYVYAVVAIDEAKNMSAQSVRVTETAR